LSNTTTRRRFLGVFVLTTAGGVLAACSQGASVASPPTTAPAPTTASLAPTAPTTASLAPTATTVARTGQAVPNDHPTIAALYEAAKKEGKLSWWDAHDQAQVQKFAAAFNKHFPNIEVEYLQAPTDVTRTRAVQEARAGRVSFDLVNTGENWPAYKDAGIVDAKTDFTNLLLLAGVDAQFIIEGTCAPEFNVYGSAYNTNLVKAEDLPDHLDGFSDPKWKGQLAIEARLRPYVYGTSFLGGEDKVVDMLRRLKANNPRPTDGDIKSQTLLIAGEFPVLIGAYLQRYISMKGKPWGFVPFKEVWSNSPRQGYVVPNGAPHPNAGKLFMWWLVGPEGQALTDKERFKGNPAPGTGTGPSKWLEEHRMGVRFAPIEYDLNYDKYLRKYLEALGLPVT
jgi:iron(III) transport system substrate-binding protein